MRSRAVAVILLTLVTIGGCTNTTVAEYGSAARANFVTACQSDTSASGGTTSTSLMAPRRYCECVYGKLAANNGLPFDQLMALEERLSTKALTPSELPSPLRKAVSTCSIAGPEAGG